MADLGISDIVGISQTLGIIGTMIIVLYFVNRQMKMFTVDLESRILNDLYEKIMVLGK